MEFAKIIIRKNEQIRYVINLPFSKVYFQKGRFGSTLKKINKIDIKLFFCHNHTNTYNKRLKIKLVIN